MALKLTGDSEPTNEQQPSEDFLQFLEMFARRRRVFWTILLSFVVIMVAYTLLVPKKYTSDVMIIAGNAAPTAATQNTNLPVLNALFGAAGVQSSETYAELIQEPPVAQQVIDNLHLDIDVGKLTSTKHLNVQPVENTQILDVGVTWWDPEKAAKIANEFAKVFVERERELIAGQASQAVQFLLKALPAAETEMRAADMAVARFQASHSIADINSQTSSFVAQIGDLNQRLAAAQVDQSQARSQLANVESQLRGGSTEANPINAQLQSELAQTESDLAAARKQYTESHPLVVSLEQREAQLKKQIAGPVALVPGTGKLVPDPVSQQLDQQAAALKAQISGDEAQITQLKVEMDKLGPTLRNLPAESQHLADLQRRAMLAENVFTQLRQKYNDAMVAKTAALSDVAITSPADPNLAVPHPKVLLNLLVAPILGLLLALSGVLVVEFLDSSLKNERDARRVLGLPILANVPSLEQPRRRKFGVSNRALASINKLRALTIEAFLQLVDGLRYSSDKPLRVLAITSALPSDGKTTVALNAAVAMAEIQPRVLLIDGDMRKPEIHSRLRLNAEPGLSDVLVGASELTAAVQPTKFRGLDIMAAGPAVPNPMTLLRSERFDEVIRTLLDNYRMIVFDTPALLGVRDALVLGSKANGTVVVVAAGQTDSRSVKASLSKLASVKANVVGIVLNRAMVDGYVVNYHSDETFALPIASAIESAESH